VNWERLAAVRTIVLVLLGLCALVTAAFLWTVPAGLCAAGVALLALAYLTDPNGAGGN